MTARAARAAAALTPARAVTVRRLRDRGVIRERLGAGAPLAAYTLAYLDARRFALADFYEAESSGRRAYVFYSRGGLGPSSQLFGDSRVLAALLRLHPGPRSTLLTCEPEHVETALATHHLWRPQTMLRMQLDRDAFTPFEGAASVRRLIGADAAELNRLYALEGDGIWYSRRQIEDGVYYGALHRGRVVAAAGTHIHSASERAAVVGNVFTHPDFRGHDLATAVTSAVTAHLSQSCDLIVLSVDPANRTARHVYERLGYREAGRLVEAMATRRAVLSPLPLLRRLLARRRSGDPAIEVLDL